MTRFTRFPQAIGVTFSLALALSATIVPARAQVLFQQFYYPIDKPRNGMSWWQQATLELPTLARLGVASIWHPVPVKGGSGGVSMGYDPYDLYDLGSKNQKGTAATNFGTKNDYLAYIAAAHASGIRVVADVVLNHSGGADQAETNPLMEKLGWDDIADDTKVGREYRPANYDPATMNLRSWTRFLPKGAEGTPGSGRFPRDYRHFHPSAVHPDRDAPYHNPEFGNDYCYEAEGHYVWNNLCDWGLWFRAQTGIDGFRLDAVKLIDPPFLADFAAKVKHDTTTTGQPFYLVGEFWDTNHTTLTDFQRATNQRMNLFDFGLFYGLWDMTEDPAKFDIRDLWIRRFADRSHAVMFVSNHDVDRFQPIKRDKRILPYALIMTMAGQPSIFYSDYFRSPDTRLPQALEVLTSVHNRFAIGKEILRYGDRDVLAIERQGNLLGVFNDGGDGTARTLTVPTGFGANIALRSVGQIANDPVVNTTTNKNGTVTVTVPPGGYLLLTRADANERTHPDRFRSGPLPTQQTWEFADDLDTGRLGPTPYTIPLTLRLGSSFLVTVADTSGSGTVTVTLQDSNGRTIVARTAEKATSLALRTRIPRAGVYRLIVRTSGEPTKARLTVRY